MRDTPDVYLVTLHVLRYFPTLTETFVHDAIVAQALAGHSVAIAAFDARESSGRPAPAVVHSQPHRWGWLRWWLPIARERVRGAAPLRVLWLAALLRRLRPTRVHVHFAGEAAEWTMQATSRVGLPFSVTVHAVDLFKPRPGTPALLRAASEVFTISNFNRSWIAARYGVDAVVDRCLVASASETVRIPGQLLFVGRNVPKKGLDALLDAVRHLPAGSFALDVISDIPDPGIPGVTVRGLLPHAEVLARIGRASAVVLPCRRAPDGDMDGIPVVLLEALAASVPVVTTAVSGIPEVVDDAVGWLITDDESTEFDWAAVLAQALAEVLGNPEEAQRRGLRGPARLRERGFIA